MLRIIMIVLAVNNIGNNDTKSVDNNSHDSNYNSFHNIYDSENKSNDKNQGCTAKRAAAPGSCRISSWTFFFGQAMSSLAAEQVTFDLLGWGLYTGLL